MKISAVTLEYMHRNEEDHMLKLCVKFGCFYSISLNLEEREKFKTRSQEEKEAFYSNSADYVAAVAKEKLVKEKWGIGGPNSRA